MGEARSCQVCGYGTLTLLLNMGSVPLPENMRTDAPRYSLRLVECRNCHLAQLTHIADPRLVFPPAHPYASGNTRALRQHFAQLAMWLLSGLNDGDLVVDIGANDGTLLRAFAMFKGGLRLVGVEPTNQARKMGDGIDVRREFFSPGLADALYKQYGPAKLITAANVLAHVPDVHGFLAGVTSLLSDQGLFVTENHDWASVAEGLQIDTIYHEHLRYYSLASLSYLLEMHDLSVADYQRVPIHGGSFRVTARKWQGRTLGLRAVAVARSLYGMLDSAATAGPVYGIGATTRATPLIHYTGIAKFIDCVCEITGSEKIGTVMPGTTIPVVDEEKLLADQPPHALLLSWHLRDGLIPKLRSAGYKGKFIIPLPEPEITD